MSAPTTSKPTKPAARLAIAACSIALGGGNEIQLMPAGPFRAIDGRPGIDDKGKPTGIPTWQVNGETVADLVARINSRVNPYVIDYEHQTLRAKQNGKPAPAAGWIGKVEWRGESGLWATDVEWTPAAHAMIEAGEYKFISPVFAYDDAGNVTGLLMAAITNNPAIDGMDEVMIAAASIQYTALTTTTQESHMEELLERLRWMLNLPISATADEILVELNKLIDQIKAAQGGTAAASGDAVALFASMNQKIADLSATAPDPEQFVPIAALTATRDQVVALTGQLAELTAQLGTNALDDAVKSALSDGRLLPAQEAWARQLGAKNMAALTSYLESAPKVAALGAMQTRTNPPPQVGGITKLSDDQIALCTALGVPQDQYLKTLQAEAST